MVSEWLESLEITGMSQQTVANRRSHISQFERFRGRRLINKDLIDEYCLHVREKYESYNTIYIKFSTLKLYLKYLKINVNIVLPKKKRKIIQDYFKQAEINLIMSCFKGKYKHLAMLELLYGCGLRRGELLKIELFDIDFDERAMLVRGKGDRVRYVPLTSIAVYLIGKYIDEFRPQSSETTKLFVTRTGKDFKRETVDSLFRHMKTKLPNNLKDRFHPHALRHSIATHLMNNGVPVILIQEFLGHSNIETTQIYTHLDHREMVRVVDLFHPRVGF
ncbi:MAG: hypothetical protein COA79_21120 [Planctomycetota bacterium]|nr:MAG: hypothetical protein COA79_21120 [Planctomycetota bacterium]